MTTVSGEIAVLLDVLGHRKGDSRILDAIVLVGPKTDFSEYDFEGEKSTYYVFKPAGTELLFEDDVLVSVMVRTQPDPEDETYGQYRVQENCWRDFPSPPPAAKSQHSSAIRNAPDRVSTGTRPTTAICISSSVRMAEPPGSPHY